MRGAARVHPAWLTGMWEGTAYQVIASKGAAQEVDVTVTLAEGGEWKAMNRASGASWLTGN